MIQNGKPLDISAAQTGNKNVYLFQFNLWQNLTELRLILTIRIKMMSFLSVQDQGRYREIFQRSNNNGSPIMDDDSAKNIFLKSRLSPDVLGHIWGLVDVNNSGTLNLNQFIVAMGLIQKKMTINDFVLPKALPHLLLASISPNNSSSSLNQDQRIVLLVTPDKKSPERYLFHMVA